MKNKSIKHIAIFDSLRGLMAFWVVLAHTFMSYNMYLPGGLSKIFNVAFAVEVFIILSGFVIFFLLDKQKESYIPFITRRFFRIFPVYWVLLIISVLTIEYQLVLWQSFDGEGHYWKGRLGTTQDSVEYYTSHLLAHIPLLQGLFPHSVLPNSDFAFIEPAWSLSLEWQFYLVAPAIFIAICNARNSSAAGLTLLSISVLISYFYGKGGVGFLPKEMHLFILGIISFYVWKHYYSEDNKILITIILAAVASSIILRSVPLLIWFIFMYLAATTNATLIIIKQLLVSKPMMFLANISYPMYLVHTLVIYLPLYLNNQLGVGLSSTEVIASTIVLSIILSYLLHVLVEKPGMALGKKITRKKETKIFEDRSAT